MAIERASPRAHLVVDDFFAPPALATIFSEIAGLELGPGLVRDIGHDGQSIFFENPRRRNQAVWIHDPSKTLRLFREGLWSPRLLPVFAEAREALFQIIPNCWSPNLQVSRYMTGDHYDLHEDEGAGVNLTAIVFLARSPAKVRGGDLVLAYGGEETTIRFRHNRLVIFPSKTLHRVTRVRVDSADPRDARISLQSWLTYGTAPAKIEPRPPEADRPTFLLAEEAILGAAQALLDGEGTERTPDELYWGAFYLCRILTQNLRWLALESGIALGPIKVRRARGGEALEVYGRARRSGEPLLVGFALRGAEVEPGDALRLIVETGRGSAKKAAQRPVPRGAGDAQTLALLRRLLGPAAR